MNKNSMRSEIAKKCKNAYFAFYKGIIFTGSTKFLSSEHMEKLVKIIIINSLQKGMNLKEIILKATQHLDSFFNILVKYGISGFVSPLELLHISKPECVFVGGTKKDVQIAAEATENVINSYYSSIAVLLKLKVINDDNKNGFMTYDMAFYLDQVNQFEYLKCRI